MKKNPVIISILVLLTFTGCSVYKHNSYNNNSLSKTGKAEFLFLSDIHLNTDSVGTSYGNDTGTELWRSFLAKVDSLLSSSRPPGFAIYTGDLPSHYPCSGNCYLPPNARQKHNRDLSTILTDLRDLFTKHHTPFFYIPGNNDALAGDYYSFADEQGNTPLSLVTEIVNPYPALNIHPAGNKAPCMVSNAHPSMGYYSARPIEGLRMIGLNTVIYAKHFLTVDGTHPIDDGNDQMNWLAAELKDSKAKGDKVYIAMHIPPGNDAYKFGKTPDNASMWVRPGGQNYTWENRFLALVDQYQSSIAGILFGHTHMDEIRRLYDSTGTHITAVAISAPGVTPQHDNNPGFKLVQYEKKTKDLLDCTTYYTLPSASSWGNRSYSMDSVFNFSAGNSLYKNICSSTLADLSRSMNRVYTVMHGEVNYDIQPGIEVKFGQ